MSLIFDITQKASTIYISNKEYNREYSHAVCKNVTVIREKSEYNRKNLFCVLHIFIQTDQEVKKMLFFAVVINILALYVYKYFCLLHI